MKNSPLSLQHSYCGSDTVVIFFSPLEFPEGKFAYSRACENLLVDKIFVREDGDPFYTWSIEEVVAQVSRERRREGWKKTVYWGSSSGGYGAMLASILDPGASVVAFAPHLRLDAPFCSASLLAASGVKYNPKYTSIFALMEAEQFAGPMELVFPLISGKDSVHVLDSLNGLPSHVNVRFSYSHHGVEACLKREMLIKDVVSDYLYFGTLPNAESFRCKHLLFEALLLREMYIAEYEGNTAPIIPQEMRTSNYELLYWSSRQCWRRGDLAGALALCLKAIAVSSTAPDHYHETLGNFALEMGLYSMARDNYELVVANAVKSGAVASKFTIQNHAKVVKILNGSKE